jgi:hypothetical protein
VSYQAPAKIGSRATEKRTNSVDLVVTESTGSISFTKMSELNRRSMLKTAVGRVVGEVSVATLQYGIAHASDVVTNYSG